MAYKVSVACNQSLSYFLFIKLFIDIIKTFLKTIPEENSNQYE